jgi:hypothetical protein
VLAVKLIQLEQQVAAPDTRSDRVQSADPREAIGDRLRGAGAHPATPARVVDQDLIQVRK